MKNIVRISISLLCFAFIASFYLTGAFAATPAETKVRTNTLKPGPSITVVAPKAGDSFGAGTQTTVSWTYKNLKGTVRVLLYKAGSPVTNPVIISMTLTGTGNLSFSWILDAGLTPGSDYTIVVESNDNPGIKGVSAPFTILPFKKGAPPSLGADSDSNKEIRACPEKITVEVQINKNGIKTVAEGFESEQASNQSSEFTLAKTGMENDKKCYCEYTIGNKISARFYAKMGRHGKCHTYGPKQLIIYKR